MKLPKNYPWTKKPVEHHLENLRNPHSAVYGDEYCACCNMLLPYPDEPWEAAQTRLYIQLVEIAPGERGPKRDW